jgi:hypothetical protein
MQIHRVALIGVVSLALVAACGSGNDGAESAGNPTETTSGPTADDGGGGGGGRGSDEFCAAVQAFSVGLAELDQTLSPAEQTAQVDELTRTMADTAPSELEDELAVIRTADPTSDADIRTPEYRTAITEIGAYVEAECGIATDQ